MKNRIALILSAILILSVLTACGAGGAGGNKAADSMTPEEVIAAATENLNQVQSMTYDMDMDMEFAVTVASAGDQNMDIKMTSQADYVVDPIRMKITMNMDMGTGESLDAIVYLAQTGDGFDLYTGTENEDGSFDWTRQELTDMPDLQQYQADKSMALYLTNGESFTENGTETVNGVEAVRYDGIIRGDSLEDVMDSSGMTEQLAAMNLGSEEDLFEDAGDLPISIWIDKEELMPVKYEMDMTALMQGIMERSMAQQMEGVEGAEDVKVTVGKVFTSMIITGINNVGTIKVPEEALDAELIDAATAAEMDPTAE